MFNGPSTGAASVRNQVRDNEHAAKRLIMRAAHLEKLARRSWVGAAQCISLEAQARDLRATAAVLLTEVSEISKQVTAA
jgi:hypothetical protein